MVNKSVRSSKTTLNSELNERASDKIIFGYIRSWPREIYKDYRGVCFRTVWIKLL